MGHIHHFVGEMALFFGLMIYLMFYLYIKILVSEQGNAVCEKLSNCHNLLIMRNDKKDYRNSQHFAFAF